MDIYKRDEVDIESEVDDNGLRLRGTNLDEKKSILRKEISCGNSLL